MNLIYLFIVDIHTYYKAAKLQVGHMLSLVHQTTTTSGENILKAYKKIESEVDIINAVEGDNQFSFQAFQEYNNEKNILGWNRWIHLLQTTNI